MTDRDDSSSGFDSLLRELARGPAAETQAAADRALVGSRLGPFQVLEVLGRGGLGTVFLAEDTRLLRRVALKLLHERGTEHEAVLREARAAAAVAHPNVASVWGVEEHEGRTLLVMEYVPGQTLRALVPEGGLPWREAWRFARQVAQGLAHAHGLGIVHRDLKPDNVRVTPEGVARILDFGLARPESASLPAAADASGGSTTPAGTPRYMAPELLQKAPADRRSDVFAFGVMLHELLTGTPAAADAPPPRRGPRGLARLVARCLASDPRRRPASGAELVSALDRESPGRWLAWRLSAAGLLAALGLATALVVGAGPAPTLRAEQLTRNLAEAPVTQAALSPDGRTLAFVDTRGLLLLDLATRRERHLLGAAQVDSFSFLSWFDDGVRLLFRPREDASGSRLAVVDTRSGATRLIGQAGPWRFAAPSPDGTQVAFVRLGTNERGDLGVFGIDRPEDLRTLYVARPDERLFSHAAWSPDGARVAFGRYSGKFDVKDASLASVELSDGTVRAVVSGAGVYQQSLTAAFTFTGATTLAFAERSGEGQRLRIARLGRDVTLEERGAFPSPIVDRLSCDRTGQRFTVLGFAKQADVWRARLSTRPPQLTDLRRLTTSARDEWPSGWSRDDAVLVQGVGPDGPFAAEVPLESGVLAPLLTGAGWTTWPTASHLGTLFFRVDPLMAPAEARLWLRGPGGTNALEITVPTGGVDGPERPPPRVAWVRCAAKARRCVVGRQQPAGLVLAALDEGGALGPAGAPVDVAWSRGFALSPDGLRVAVPDQARRRLVIASLDGQVTQELLAERGVAQFASFTADGQGLVVSTLGGGEHSTLALWALDGTRTPLWSAEWAWITHPVVSPDGASLAFAVTPFHGNVWLLE